VISQISSSASKCPGRPVRYLLGIQGRNTTWQTQSSARPSTSHSLPNECDVEGRLSPSNVERFPGSPPGTVQYSTSQSTGSGMPQARISCARQWGFETVQDVITICGAEASSSLALSRFPAAGARWWAPEAPAKNNHRQSRRRSSPSVKHIRGRRHPLAAGSCDWLGPQMRAWDVVVCFYRLSYICFGAGVYA
jgi:hypothetical protein